MYLTSVQNSIITHSSSSEAKNNKLFSMSCDSFEERERVVSGRKV